VNSPVNVLNNIIQFISIHPQAQGLTQAYSRSRGDEVTSNERGFVDSHGTRPPTRSRRFSLNRPTTSGQS